MMSIQAIFIKTKTNNGPYSNKNRLLQFSSDSAIFFTHCTALYLFTHLSVLLYVHLLVDIIRLLIFYMIYFRFNFYFELLQHVS